MTAGYIVPGTGTPMHKSRGHQALITRKCMYRSIGDFGRLSGRKGWMKIRRSRIPAMAGVALVLAGIAGSGMLWIQKGGQECPQESSGLSGSLQIVGSSSMEKLAHVLAEGFMEKYPDVSVSIQFTGTSAGVEAVAEGRADIGNVSRDLTEGERARGIVENRVGLDGIAVCVDSGNPVDSLTGEQLAGIYTGEITNWAWVGGEDIPIVTVGREAGSGTRSAFEGLLGVENRCTYANELDSTGAVMARVAATPGAIGYVSFDAVWGGTQGHTVKAVALNGVPPGAETVRSGDYPLCRTLSMVTKGEMTSQNRLVTAWFDYVYGEEGRNAAEKAGIIGISTESNPHGGGAGNP